MCTYAQTNVVCVIATIVKNDGKMGKKTVILCPGEEEITISMVQKAVDNQNPDVGIGKVIFFENGPDARIS